MKQLVDIRQFIEKVKIKKDKGISKVETLFTKLRIKLENNKIYRYFTDTSSFKKTLLLSVLFVFLFYLPFTILTLGFDQVVFFQLDYLYQFATIIFDFRNRVFDLNFSTWDWKNTIGYDYFANFYYVPVDFSLIPYFLFPFISFSKQMWLSFLLKVLVGTAAFSYLLKLYKINHKTILFMSVLYGTADLFFAQNVFPTFTNLIYNIPLMLIAIELIFQKKKYWVFSLVIFHISLSNFYWAWLLTVFMTLALLFRTIYEFVTWENILKLKTYFNMAWFLFKCLIFYLIGIGLAAFFVLPIISVMLNEPRMNEMAINFKDAFSYKTVVYLKTVFKMLVPNLYNYSGYFYDNSQSYWVPTNHVIIYSSIMATYTVVQFFLYPSILAKQKLSDKQFKIYQTLKYVNVITVILMLFPIVAYVFSLTPVPYLRWYTFFGFLLIINLAFIIELKMFNIRIFLGFVIGALVYLLFSIKYNNAPNVPKEGFFAVDEGIAYTMITVYSIMIVFMIIFDKYKGQKIFLLIERIAFLGSIYVICVTAGFSYGVKHNDVYGAEVNQLMKQVQLQNEYNVSMDLLSYNDETDIEGMQNMTYLFDFKVFNNLNIFHSLINPYYTFYKSNAGHERYYRSLDMPFLYYYYLDPTLFIFSESTKVPIDIGIHDPESRKLAEKTIPELDSVIKIYEKDPNFSLGTGFTTIYTKKYPHYYEYQFLKSLYVYDKELIAKLQAEGFNEANYFAPDIFKTLTYDRSTVKDYIFPNYPSHLSFKELTVSVTKEQSDFIINNYYWTPYIRAFYLVDNNDQITRCYNRFCYVPEAGVKKLIVGFNTSNKNQVDGKLDLYTLNKDMFNEQVEALKANSTYDVMINGNNITAKINNEEPVVMTFKIGYAKGWTAYVDGKQMETFPSYNGQLSFVLKTTGVQDIHLVYETPLLKEGLYITGACALVFGGILVYEFIIKKRRDKHEEVI